MVILLAMWRSSHLVVLACLLEASSWILTPQISSSNVKVIRNLATAVSQIQFFNNTFNEVISGWEKKKNIP